MRSPWEIIRKSLALKLIATAGLSLVFSVAALSWVAIIHQEEILMSYVVNEADRLGNTIKLGTRYAMMINSRDDLIDADVDQNEVFFLPENSAAGNSWCYYYEKASLAAQLGNWEEVVQLAGTAFNLDDHPNDASERLPFIEGYARTGDLENALNLTRETAAVSPLYQPMLCQLWQDLAAESADSAAKSAAIEQITVELSCE